MLSASRGYYGTLRQKVRAFVIKGGRILWASMCDKMSCISVEDPVDKDAEHRREDIARARSKGGVRLHETAHGMPVGASVETNVRTSNCCVQRSCMF